MSNEINIKSILDLDKQIMDQETSIIKLKRTRNSLLNVSRIPAEILGEIFCWNTVSRGALEKRSHNFLLVCHYWFEVASSTPELWSFWGNNLEDWKKHNLRYPTAPLDISSRNALQDRASRDTIRCIHFVSTDSRLLDSILSQLRADCDGIRPSSVESFVARDRNRYPSFDCRVTSPATTSQNCDASSFKTAR